VDEKSAKSGEMVPVCRQ